MRILNNVNTIGRRKTRFRRHAPISPAWHGLIGFRSGDINFANYRAQTGAGNRRVLNVTMTFADRDARSLFPLSLSLLSTLLYIINSNHLIHPSTYFSVFFSRFVGEGSIIAEASRILSSSPPRGETGTREFFLRDRQSRRTRTAPAIFSVLTGLKTRVVNFAFGPKDVCSLSLRARGAFGLRRALGSTRVIPES